jgi:S1-C subfamily serine protease
VTGVDLLDLLIILAAIGYGFGGFRSGAVVGIFSVTGFFGGAVLGAQLAEPIGSAVASGRAQVPIAIVCVLFFAMLGHLTGVWLAGHVRARFVVHQKSRALDAGVGSGLGVLAVLLFAWMVAVPLASSPYPRLASQATHSKIVRAVDDVMPDGLRNLYSSLRSFLDESGFPPVFGDLPSTPILSVAPPPNLSPALRQHVEDAEGSIFKIYGDASSCDRRIEGTGFVYAPQHIVTNAHVVAGTESVTVQAAGQGNAVKAQVVLYDRKRDIAVLYAPDVTAPPLRLAAPDNYADTGDPAVVLGYPQDGPFTTRTARVRSHATVSGRDIYGEGHVRREIYAVRAVVRKGNSGGPLLGANGRVLGVVFATAVDSPDTGFVLTNKEIKSDLADARNATGEVGTAGCIPE